MVTFLNLGGMGHLGNQLFQIAACVGVAEKNNDKAVFSNWKYTDYFNGPFNFDELIVNKTYFETKFGYNEIKYNPNLNLDGYFQSEKYFKHCSDKILQMFSFKNENQLRNKWDNFLNKNTCSIHIRRGDYLLYPNDHPQQILEYYINAIKIIEKKHDIDYYLVFSDDINWCKENFKSDKYIFIEGQYNTEDLSLMSYCDHNIICNSSFSWWGSWLNKNEDKMIIAPKKWFGDNKHRNGIFEKDIYTNKMIVI